MKYDPMNTPDPDEWRELDEAEQLTIVVEYHKEHDAEMPAPLLHAGIHIIVENQIAMGDEIPTRRALERLMNQGLDRHDAIHAIGSVLAAHMHRLMQQGEVDPTPNEKLYRDLESLTADSWRKPAPDAE